MSNIKELDVDDRSFEILKKLAEDQEKPEGRPYIFAPNHLEPENIARRLSGASDDFPVLNKVLRDAGFTRNYPVGRGDADMNVKGPISEWLYETHQKARTGLGTSIADSLPLDVNKKEPVLTRKRNVGGLKRIIDVLKNREGNITLYPYASWIAPGKQDFRKKFPCRAGSLRRKSHKEKRGTMRGLPGSSEVPSHSHE